jgi:hypothetical protein
MPLRIPGLPDHIAVVPEGLLSPDDPDQEAKREVWHQWVEAVLRYRVTRRRDIEKHPSLRRYELRFCAEHPAYWLLIWGNIFEPRSDGSRSSDAPFLLYPFQIDLLNWFLERMDSSGADADGVVSKSRDMGASWLMCAFAVWGWLFKLPWQVRLISWREAEVDSRKPDSLFWKIDFLLEHLPTWMKPNGFDPERDRIKLTLVNPANGNVIAGESSTGRAMRGGRATWIGYDEAAFNPYFAESWEGTANVTNHRFAISTECLEHNDLFYRLRTGLELDDHHRPSVKELDWWLHPDHDLAWRDDMERRMASNPGAFEREVLRDPHAGSTTFVYPAARERFPTDLDYIPGAPLYVGIDPGNNDETAIVWFQENPATKHMHVLNAYQNRRKVADFYGTLIKGTPFECYRTYETPENEESITHVGVGEWSYTSQEYELMDWTRTLPKPTFYGDISGMNSLGATKDTFYSRLSKFGIIVNTDRTPQGDVTANRMQARTHKGRIEAMKELIPRLDFANTGGARLALRALQSYQWETDDRPRASEPKNPLHDWSSHLVSAMEYVAANLRIRRQVFARELAKPRRSVMGVRAMVIAR